MGQVSHFSLQSPLLSTSGLRNGALPHGTTCEKKKTKKGKSGTVEMTLAA
jgi:hypothetical protein